ncbi:MAG: hypothetical protein M0Q46_04605 [Endomicrobiales bacterium]|nr:hypothetical protein [Endomicrobiales bacterium]
MNINYEDVFLKVFGLFLRVCVVYAIYKVSSDLTENSKKPAWRIYLNILLVSLFASWLCSSNLGSYIDTENADPLFGGGDGIQEYVPTIKEKYEHALFIFTVMFITSFKGVYDALRKRK